MSGPLPEFKPPEYPLTFGFRRSEPKAWAGRREGLFLIPMQGLELSIRSTRFFDGSVLSEANRSDIALFNRPPSEVNSFPVSTWYAPRTLVTGECLFRVKATGNDFDTSADRVRNKVGRLITAFRLVHGDSPSPANGVAVQPGSKDSWAQFSPSYPIDEIGLAFSYSGVVLDRRNVKEVRLIYENLGRLTRQGRLAVTRFNRATTRESDDDRLIDLWIALEALFSPAAGGENTFRMSLRLARFIAPPTNRNHVYSTLLDSYHLRSDVVHGRRLTPQSERLKLDPQSLIALTAGYVRAALRKITIEKPKFTPDYLDEVIVRGTVR